MHSTTITSTYHRYNGSWPFVSTYLQPDIWIVRWSFCLILMHDPSTATFTFWSILTLWNEYDAIKDSILRMEVIHQYNSRFHYHQRFNNRCSPILLLQSLFHSFIQGRLMLIGCATLFGQELDLLVVARLSNHDLTYHAIVVKAGLSATFSLSPINIALIDSSEWIILANMN